MDLLIQVGFVMLLVLGNLSFLFHRDREPRVIRWLSPSCIFALGLLLGFTGFKFPANIVVGIIIATIMVIAWVSVRNARPY